MKIKVSEATPLQLDWMIAKAEGKDSNCEIHGGNILYGRVTSGFIQYRPSTNWSQGGPIIEQEELATCTCGVGWEASKFFDVGGEVGAAVEYGPTPLIAAMRCYVASKLGDEVEVPDGL